MKSSLKIRHLTKFVTFSQSHNKSYVLKRIQDIKLKRLQIKFVSLKPQQKMALLRIISRCFIRKSKPYLMIWSFLCTNFLLRILLVKATLPLVLRRTMQKSVSKIRQQREWAAKTITTLTTLPLTAIIKWRSTKFLFNSKLLNSYWMLMFRWIFPPTAIYLNVYRVMGSIKRTFHQIK